MAPLKVVLPSEPVVKVWLDRSTAPAPASEPMRWSAPSTSVAPPATATAAGPTRRSAAASVRLPPSTASVSAADVPCSVLAPDEVSAPAPRLALTVASISA